MVDKLKGIVNGEDFGRVSKSRCTVKKYLTVKKDAEVPYLKEGWQVERQNSNTVRLSKDKPLYEQFEDKVWCSLAKMGFQEMNEGRDFKIPISEDERVNGKQVDVFAKDEGVALVIECKSAENYTKGNFRKDILEIGGYRGGVVKSIKEHYNEDLKIGWVFATKNYSWNDTDIALAKEKNISVLKDEELDYYKVLSDQLGTAAKYQLLAKVFSGTHIPSYEVKVPAIRGNLGGNRFYAFAIEPARLLPIAFVAHRMNPSKETSLVYQRILKKNRLKSIREYLDNEHGFFPNSIVINFQNQGGKDALRFDKSGNEANDTDATPGYLYLPGKYKSAFVIDGQHRLYGFSGTKAASNTTIPVIAFENLDAYKQADMFVDINSKQVKVPKNLLGDLYADLLWESKYEKEKMLALISKTVLQLNEDRESPLFNKVKSSSESGKLKPITITTLTESIRKSNLFGQVENGPNILIPGPLYAKKAPLMENSLERATKILMSYFRLFENGVPDNWKLGDGEGGYLCTNNGLAALILVLKEIIREIGKEHKIDAINLATSELIDEIARYSGPLVKYFANLDPTIYRTYRKQFGSQGQRNSSLGMMEAINKEFPNFEPSGLSKYIEEKNSSFNVDSVRLVQQIQLMVRDDVISELKKNFGETGEKWFYDPIPQEVRIDIANRQQTDPEHGDKLQYFDLVHYEKIISANWDLFKDRYGFKELGNSKVKQLSWYDTLVKLRNRISHPERPKASKEEYEFLKSTYDRLKNSIT